jgi:hypothetical protein
MDSFILSPHKGEKGAWFRAMDSLPLRCAPAGNDTKGVGRGVIPGERSEGRGSMIKRDLSPPPPCGEELEVGV